MFDGEHFCGDHVEEAINRYRAEHCVPPGVHKFDLVTSNGDTVIARQCRRCGFVVPEARAG